MEDNLKMFSGYKLEKNSPVPLYFQIERLIREKIFSGELREGDKLPTEIEFMKEFEVSRPTLRQAIANLNRDGLIDIKRGYGTFIKTQDFEEPVLGIRSYSEEAIKQGYKPVTKIVSFNVIEPDMEISKIFNLENDNKVYELVRLRLLNDEPTAIDTTYFPVKIAPKFSIKDLRETGKGQSLYNLLKTKHGVSFNSGEETIDATSVNKEEARLLDMENKGPINLRKRIILDNQNRTVLYMKAIYKTRYKIRLEGPF